jgi:predicted small secreted protein
MRKTFIPVLLSLAVIGGAPSLLSACNTAAGAGEDVSATAHAIPGGTDKNKTEMAQAQQSPPLPPAAPSAKDIRVEARIKSLHDRLKITSAEEPQWSGVAQAMRDNARQMQGAIEQRREARNMTAVDDLKAYQLMADTHAQGLEKLIPAFEALYDSMSDVQKKKADAIFGESRRHKKSMHHVADAGKQHQDF